MGLKRVMNSRMAAVGAGAAVLALLAGGAGYAAGEIDSGDIQNNSVRSVDVKDGDLRKKDMRPSFIAKWAKVHQLTYVRQLVADQQTTIDEQQTTIDEQQAAIEDLTSRVEDLEETADTGVNTNWDAGANTSIVDDHTATLTGGNTSIEIENLNKVVQAGDVVSFTVSFGDGAFCVAGAPRVFVEVGGTFYNSFDQDTPCANNTAPDAANNTAGTIDFTIPVNGRIGAAGLVWDNGNTGTVTITNLTIGGDVIEFQ